MDRDPPLFLVASTKVTQLTLNHFLRFRCIVINIDPAEKVGAFRSSSSEWPQFSAATSPASNTNRSALASGGQQSSLESQTVPLTGRSPTITPSPRVGGANSPRVGTTDASSTITRSVPGTPQAGFGVGRTSLGGVGSAAGLRGQLGSPGLDVNGALGDAQRGFSNPDLTKAFGRAMNNFQKGDDFGPLHDDVSISSSHFLVDELIADAIASSGILVWCG